MTFRPTIRTQTDLQDAWSHLMGPRAWARIPYEAGCSAPTDDVLARSA